MHLRHQAYTLYYRHVCILVFLYVFAYSMLLRCMLKFKRLACGSEDVTQYNHVNYVKRFDNYNHDIKKLMTVINGVNIYFYSRKGLRKK